MPVGPGSAIVIPAGTRHDIINTGPRPLKLYTMYARPHHRDGVVHHGRADAEKDSEHLRRQNDALVERRSTREAREDSVDRARNGCRDRR